MSTRANVKIKGEFGDEILFYRHSDGYPEGTLPTLYEFLKLVGEGKIRKNASQASGWLVAIGAKEYGRSLTPDSKDKISGWKIGAYEPCSKISEWAEYIYEIDLDNLTISISDEYDDEKENEKLTLEEIKNKINKN